MKKRSIKRIILVLILSLALFCVPILSGVAATKVKINKKKATILVSKTVQLKINGQKKVKWSSSNKKIAKVSKTGKVTGIKPGKVTIKAKVKKKTYKCKITVRIGLDKTRITLNVGQTTKVKLCGSRIKAVKSSNNSVAKISKAGKIRAVGAGSAILTIKGKNKKRYTCKVTVRKIQKKAPVKTKKYYQVSFDSNGGSEIASQKVESGKTATVPDDPDYEGYTFDCWELNGKAYDFSTPITANITLKAKWAKFQWDNADELIEIIDADESRDVPTENQVINIFKDRNFEDYTPFYEYDINGECVDKSEVQDDSTEKRPMYMTYYKTEKGDVWTIYVTNGSVLAYPFSYNMESDREILVSESADITSYDGVTNQYFVTIPGDAIILKVVDRIDAETLENLTIEDCQE